MKLKALFEDDGAVSPVIGVILMVAITVILAAVIGTFVLGLGDRVSEASPNAQFGFSYSGTDGDADGVVTITHDGGDGVESSQLKVTVDGKTAWESGSEDPDTEGFNSFTSDWSGKITAGATLEFGESTTDLIDDGHSVKVIWTASGSDKTAVIGESEVSL